MAFVLLIVEGREDRMNRPKDVGIQAYDQMVRFFQGLQARGILKAVESLKSDREAARIQTRDGKRRMVDGPFAESKEIVGGFFLLDVATREEALRIASECHAAGWAAVEVRGPGPGEPE